MLSRVHAEAVLGVSEFFVSLRIKALVKRSVYAELWEYRFHTEYYTTMHN